MAKPKLTAITIRPSKGGGHKVTHEYAAAPKYSAGGRNGGMSMDQAPPEEHNFQAGEHNSLMQHIASALALKGLGMQRPGSTPGMGGPGAGLGQGMPPGA
jgi:hypothetical protein